MEILFGATWKSPNFGSTNLEITSFNHSFVSPPDENFTNRSTQFETYLNLVPLRHDIRCSTSVRDLFLFPESHRNWPMCLQEYAHV